MPEANVNQLVGHLFRHEAGKMAAVLTRLLGWRAMDIAEDLVQDTLLKAMSAWKINGVPENPTAWLYTVAKRKAVDYLWQQQVHLKHQSEINQAVLSEWTLTPAIHALFLEHEIQDSQLRMMFACCHPSIPYEAQVALTLKTLGGLSTAEIANRFFTHEETITKRIYRAREKIKEENVSLEAPIPAHLPGRLDAVLHTIYLLFNEGYHSSHPVHLIRHDLCEEAIRLCLLLTKNELTHLPKTNALLALMCFHASRADSRVDAAGNIILLKDQDRSQWNHALIEKGKYFLEKAGEGDDISEYHLEAAIAGCHALAPSLQETNWVAIERMYSLLLQIKPSPMVQLNHAIALSYATSPQAGLNALDKISGLFHHYLYHATKAEFLVQMGEYAQAHRCYQKAIELTGIEAEKKLLIKKMEGLPEFSGNPS